MDVDHEATGGEATPAEGFGRFPATTPPVSDRCPSAPLLVSPAAEGGGRHGDQPSAEALGANSTASAGRHVNGSARSSVAFSSPHSATASLQYSCKCASTLSAAAPLRMTLVSASYSISYRPDARLGDPTFSPTFNTAVRSCPVIHLFGHTEVSAIEEEGRGPMALSLPSSLPPSSPPLSLSSPYAARRRLSCCLHVHGVLPYLFVPRYSSRLTAADFGVQLEEAMGTAFGANHSSSSFAAARRPRSIVHYVAVVLGMPFYGYYRSPREFYKVYVYDPNDVPRAANLLGSTQRVGGRRWQPHQAHIPYVFQYMIDRGIGGMTVLSVGAGEAFGSKDGGSGGTCRQCTAGNTAREKSEGPQRQQKSVHSSSGRSHTIRYGSAVPWGSEELDDEVDVHTSVRGKGEGSPHKGAHSLSEKNRSRSEEPVRLLPISLSVAPLPTSSDGAEEASQHELPTFAVEFGDEALFAERRVQAAMLATRRAFPIPSGQGGGGGGGGADGGERVSNGSGRNRPAPLFVYSEDDTLQKSSRCDIEIDVFADSVSSAVPPPAAGGGGGDEADEEEEDIRTRTENNVNRGHKRGRAPSGKRSGGGALSDDVGAFDKSQLEEDSDGPSSGGGSAISANLRGLRAQLVSYLMHARGRTRAEAEGALRDATRDHFAAARQSPLAVGIDEGLTPFGHHRSSSFGLASDGGAHLIGGCGGGAQAQGSVEAAQSKDPMVPYMKSLLMSVLNGRNASAAAADSIPPPHFASEAIPLHKDAPVGLTPALTAFSSGSLPSLSPHTGGAPTGALSLRDTGKGRRRGVGRSVGSRTYAPSIDLAARIHWGSPAALGGCTEGNTCTPSLSPSQALESSPHPNPRSGFNRRMPRRLAAGCDMASLIAHEAAFERHQRARREARAEGRVGGHSAGDDDSTSSGSSQGSGCAYGGGLNSNIASTVGDDDEADVPLTFELLDWLRDGGTSASVAEEAHAEEGGLLEKGDGGDDEGTRVEKVATEDGVAGMGIGEGDARPMVPESGPSSSSSSSSSSAPSGGDSDNSDDECDEERLLTQIQKRLSQHGHAAPIMVSQRQPRGGEVASSEAAAAGDMLLQEGGQPLLPPERYVPLTREESDGSSTDSHSASSSEEERSDVEGDEASGEDAYAEGEALAAEEDNAYISGGDDDGFGDADPSSDDLTNAFDPSFEASAATEANGEACRGALGNSSSVGIEGHLNAAEISAAVSPGTASQPCNDDSALRAAIAAESGRELVNGARAGEERSEGATAEEDVDVDAAEDTPMSQMVLLSTAGPANEDGPFASNVEEEDAAVEEDEECGDAKMGLEGGDDATTVVDAGVMWLSSTSRRLGSANERIAADDDTAGALPPPANGGNEEADDEVPLLPDLLADCRSSDPPTTAVVGDIGAAGLQPLPPSPPPRRKIRFAEDEDDLFAGAEGASRVWRGGGDSVGNGDVRPSSAAATSSVSSHPTSPRKGATTEVPQPLRARRVAFDDEVEDGGGAAATCVAPSLPTAQGVAARAPFPAVHVLSSADPSAAAAAAAKPPRVFVVDTATQRIDADADMSDGSDTTPTSGGGSAGGPSERAAAAAARRERRVQQQRMAGLSSGVKRHAFTAEMAERLRTRLLAAREACAAGSSAVGFRDGRRLDVVMSMSEFAPDDAKRTSSGTGAEAAKLSSTPSMLSFSLRPSFAMPTRPSTGRSNGAAGAIVAGQDKSNKGATWLFHRDERPSIVTSALVANCSGDKGDVAGCATSAGRARTTGGRSQLVASSLSSAPHLRNSSGRSGGGGGRVAGTQSAGGGGATTTQSVLLPLSLIGGGGASRWAAEGRMVTLSMMDGLRGGGGGIIIGGGGTDRVFSASYLSLQLTAVTLRPHGAKESVALLGRPPVFRVSSQLRGPLAVPPPSCIPYLKAVAIEVIADPFPAALRRVRRAARAKVKNAAHKASSSTGATSAPFNGALSLGDGLSLPYPQPHQQQHQTLRRRRARQAAEAAAMAGVATPAIAALLASPPTPAYASCPIAAIGIGLTESTGKTVHYEVLYVAGWGERGARGSGEGAATASRDANGAADIGLSGPPNLTAAAACTDAYSPSTEEEDALLQSLLVTSARNAIPLPSEAALIACALERLRAADADVLLSWDTARYGLGYLLQRAAIVCGVSGAKFLSRLKTAEELKHEASEAAKGRHFGRDEDSAATPARWAQRAAGGVSPSIATNADPTQQYDGVYAHRPNPNDGCTPFDNVFASEANEENDNPNANGDGGEDDDADEEELLLDSDGLLEMGGGVASFTPASARAGPFAAVASSSSQNVPPGDNGCSLLDGGSSAGSPLGVGFGLGGGFGALGGDSSTQSGDSLIRTSLFGKDGGEEAAAALAFLPTSTEAQTRAKGQTAAAKGMEAGSRSGNVAMGPRKGVEEDDRYKSVFQGMFTLPKTEVTSALRIAGRIVLPLHSLATAELKQKSYTLPAVYGTLFGRPFPYVREGSMASLYRGWASGRHDHKQQRRQSSPNALLPSSVAEALELMLRGRRAAPPTADGLSAFATPAADPTPHMHTAYQATDTNSPHGRQAQRGQALQLLEARVLAVLGITKQMDLYVRSSEMAQLYGIHFFETVSRGSQFRVESFMQRVARPFSYIMPSPSKEQIMRQNRQEAIPLVMEPFSGFYTDPVVVLDFRSLYPSIVIAYNLCYSTMLGKVSRDRHVKLGAVQNYRVDDALLKSLLADDALVFAPNSCMFVKPRVRRGVLPTMLDSILNARFEVQSVMKSAAAASDDDYRRVLDARQLALKLLANVTYGYTAATFTGRMPCSDVADSIVLLGRQTLERAIRLIEGTAKWGARVVYGDTDSLFIHLPNRSRDDAFGIAAEMTAAVNSVNPHPVTLKFEKVYMPCFMITKKRYVGYAYESPAQKAPRFDAKGIETVRRDQCDAASKALEEALRILFDNVYKHSPQPQPKPQTHHSSSSATAAAAAAAAAASSKANGDGDDGTTPQPPPSSSAAAVMANAEHRAALTARLKRYFYEQAAKVSRGALHPNDLIIRREVKLGSYASAASLPPAARVALAVAAKDPAAAPLYKERVPYIVLAPRGGTQLKDMVADPYALLGAGAGTAGGTWGGASSVSAASSSPFILSPSAPAAAHAAAASAALVPYFIPNGDYYLTKHVIPSLDRIFHLVGISFAKWYAEMPRGTYRNVMALTHHRYFSAGAGADGNQISADGGNDSRRNGSTTSGGSSSRGQQQQQQHTIDQYFSSTDCVICHRPTNSTAVGGGGSGQAEPAAGSLPAFFSKVAASGPTAAVTAASGASRPSSVATTATSSSSSSIISDDRSLNPFQRHLRAQEMAAQRERERLKRQRMRRLAAAGHVAGGSTPRGGPSSREGVGSSATAASLSSAVPSTPEARGAIGGIAAMMAMGSAVGTTTSTAAQPLRRVNSSSSAEGTGMLPPAPQQPTRRPRQQSSSAASTAAVDVDGSGSNTVEKRNISSAVAASVLSAAHSSNGRRVCTCANPRAALSSSSSAVAAPSEEDIASPIRDLPPICPQCLVTPARRQAALAALSFRRRRYEERHEGLLAKCRACLGCFTGRTGEGLTASDEGLSVASAAEQTNNAATRRPRPLRAAASSFSLADVEDLCVSLDCPTTFEKHRMRASIAHAAHLERFVASAASVEALLCAAEDKGLVPHSRHRYDPSHGTVGAADGCDDDSGGGGVCDRCGGVRNIWTAGVASLNRGHGSGDHRRATAVVGAAARSKKRQREDTVVETLSGDDNDDADADVVTIL